MARRNLHRLLAALAVVGLAGLHWLAAKNAVAASHTSASGLQIQDFLYHIVLLRELLAGNTGSIYLLDSQLQAMTLYFDAPVQHAMPLGVAPSALFIWAPFGFGAMWSEKAAIASWTLFGQLLFFTGGWRLCRKQCAGPFFWALLLTATVTSWAGLATVLLGQSSYFAAGALLHLAAARHETSERAPLLIWGFLLTLKPPYFLIGAAYVLSYRSFREVAHYVAGGAAAVAAAAAVFPAELPRYISQLSVYTSGQMPGNYRGALDVASNNTLRALFEPYLEEAAAAMSSSLLLAAALLAVFILRLSRPLALTRAQFFLAFVASISILSPYFGGYEDLLVAAAIATAVSAERREVGRREAAGLAVMLYLMLSSAVLPQIGLGFAGKASALAFAALCCGRPARMGAPGERSRTAQIAADSM